MKSFTKMVLAAFVMTALTLPCYADTVTKTTTTTTTTLRTNAPIYYGPVQDRELQELTLADFQWLATKPVTATQLFNDYQRELKQPRPNPTLVPYKLKITDHELTLTDFQGTDVSPELAQSRY